MLSEVEAKDTEENKAFARINEVMKWQMICRIATAG